MTACKFALVLSQVLFVLLAYTLFQGYLFLHHRPEMNRRTRPRILQRLGPTLQVVAVYYRQRFCLLLLPEFAEILLELAEDARAKLLRKMRLLKRDLYQLLENARSPSPSAAGAQPLNRRLLTSPLIARSQSPELFPTTSLHPTTQPPPVSTRPHSSAQFPSSRRSCLPPASRPPPTV